MVSRVQDSGKSRITAALAALSWYMQWGTGSAAAASANAVTDDDTSEARAAVVTSQATVATANDTVQMVGTLTAAGDREITEIGVFDEAGAGSPPSGGNMNVYADFPVINLGAGDSITFTIKTTFS